MFKMKPIAIIGAMLLLSSCAEAQSSGDTEAKTNAVKTTPVDKEPATPTQEPANFPETEIFLFDLNMDHADAPLSNGRNVTNRVGYDNQPFFTKDSDSFLYSRGDEYQTDIYEYAITTNEHRRLTHTEKSEFSPTPSPDNTQITYVYERNNSIWHADRGDEANPTWTLGVPGIEEPVGYFASNHKTGDLLYWSRYGYNVTLTNTDEKGAYHYVSGHAVPSTPHIIPGTNNFSFVHRLANGQVWIKELNPATKAVRPLTPIVGQNANYGWVPDGSILMIEGDTLYRNDIDAGQRTDSRWQDLANLKKLGIKNANRVAISPDGTKLAIVGLPITDTDHTQ